MKYILQSSIVGVTWQDVTGDFDSVSALINYYNDIDGFDENKFYRVITREVVEKVI